MMNDTIVLALGNPLRGDDGVGAAVLEHLEHESLVDGGTSGFEIILLMQGYERAIIIDAADMDLEPGDWRMFSPDEVRLQSRDLYLRGTLHYAGLAEALSLGEAMGLLPPEIIIFGVQPATIDWDIGLSDPVERAVPAITAAVQQVIDRG